MSIEFVWQLSGLILVGFIWGTTNPLMKKKTTNIKTIKETNIFSRIVAEINYIFTNWKFILTFLINQSGSILFFILLQYSDLSLAVPLANSVSFLFTALTGWFLGEQMPNLEGLFGILLILCGIFLCIYDKGIIE